MKLFRNALITLLAVAGSVQSAHISLDSEFGPGTITWDTTTGLQWLDLSVTFSATSAMIDAQMAPGGPLRGWGYATEAQFKDFVAPYLIPINPSDHCCTGFVYLELTGAQAFVDLVAPGVFGPFVPLFGLMELQIYSDGIMSQILSAALLFYDDHAEIDTQAVNYPIESNVFAHYLVKTPEPSSAHYLLFGLALYLLPSAMRRAFRRRTPP